MVTSGEARPVAEPGATALEFVACGQPLPGYQIRVVDGGREMPERRVGRIQFQGPSATSGYYRNPEASRHLHDDAWLDTGDLGYIARGDLYVTGRSKDVVIRGGRNLYPHDVEQALGDIPGIRRGCVAMFGCVDPGNGTERVVVVAETRETETGAKAALRRTCIDAATSLLGMPPDDVVLAPPQTVLKTSSGKIRRAAVRELYESGSIGRGPRSVWWQLLRLKLASAGPRARRLRNRLRDAAYANRVRLLFWVLTPPVWLAVVVAPTLQLRWAIVHGGARLLLRLASMPLYAEGVSRLPADEAYVVVANHSSYLDGLALVAALPRPVVFIAKGELKQRPLARVFLTRIGARMVERVDWRQGASDARGVVQDLRQGRVLLFFPEGTLTRAPGLLSFHMGAFVAAVDAGVALYPLVIRGTRSILRGQDWYPHRGHLQVAIGEPLHAAGEGWSAAVALRDEARARRLDELGEPDLATDRAAVTIDRP
jgi:1-acyl-sn-glycerol-3-phosphate acyltransferase